MSDSSTFPILPGATSDAAPPKDLYTSPALRKWVFPAVRDLPPLTGLTLVSGIIGTPIGGGEGGIGGL